MTYTDKTVEEYIQGFRDHPITLEHIVRASSFGQRTWNGQTAWMNYCAEMIDQNPDEYKRLIREKYDGYSN